MSRHRSDAARIVEFFRVQPLDVAESIYGLIAEEMRVRRPKKTAKKTEPKTPKQPKTNAAVTGAGTVQIQAPTLTVSLPAGVGGPQVRI